MRSRATSLGLILCMLMAVCISGCLDTGNDDGVDNPFPNFSAVADDGITYSIDDYKGAPFVVLFSAEWCDTPCHKSMHAINATLKDAPIIVMSTDPADDPQGISLQDWHERADSHDDEDGDTGQTLDIPFMKGIDAAEEINIDERPTIVFVNSDGGITTIHKGGLSEADEIRSYWESAGGSV